MHDDDLPVGRILSRREALALLSAAGATVLGPFGSSPSAATLGQAAASAPVPGCVVRPELIEGPYFIDLQLNRSDIRSEPSTGAAMPGALLTLALNVSQISSGTCTPLQGAMVDLWQCDAAGEYSAFEDRTVGFDTRGNKFLRGYQLTNDQGLARFTTIYPGWYSGRAVHLHFKIRKDTGAGETYEFTSQLFFDETLTDSVHLRPPYATKGKRDTRNETDRFFKDGGDRLLLATSPRGEGFDTTFGIGLDLSDARTGGPDRWQGAPGGRGRGRGQG